MNEALVVLVLSLIAFTSLLVFTRILGKQQLSQLTFLIMSWALPLAR